MTAAAVRDRFAVLIVAAGEGRRMGSVPKALLPVSDRSVLSLIVETYRSAGLERFVVVSGYHAEAVEAEAARLQLCSVRNAAPERGMFSSVQTGLSHLMRISSELSGVFVQPVDCPLVRPLTIDALVRAAIGALDDGEPNDSHRGDGVRACDEVYIPSFAGRSGHPPLLPASLLPVLLDLPPTLPGGLEAALGQRILVPVCDSAMLRDMDTKADHEAVNNMQPWLAALYPAEALELLQLRQIPPRGLAHARAVACVAEAFARLIPTCRPWLAQSGGLVHDIAKGCPAHEAAGAELLTALHLPLLARLVADHRDLTLADDEPVTERELVYLADKYCFGPRFVPLARRFGQKKDLFADDPQACAAIEMRMRHACCLEDRLRRELGQDPAALAREALQSFDTPRS